MFTSFAALRSVILSYSEIFFSKRLSIGVFVLAISFLNPNMGFAGLVSILAAYTFARFLGYQKEFLKSGYFTYNALLVGLSIGKIFTLSPLSILYIIISAVLTFLITVSLNDFFGRNLLLPILSLPFVIVSSLIHLSASKFTNLYVNDLYHSSVLESFSKLFPYWINGFLQSLGAVVFMPSSFIGTAIILLIFFHSRVLFMLAIAGYYFGVLLQGAFVGSYIQAFSDLNAFNYPLIAMALGGIFNIPSKKSYLFALVGVAMATVLIKSIDIIWSEFGIPVFTLPFLIVTLGSIYVLGLMKYELVPLIFKDTPEETAGYFYILKSRYPQHTTMYLPFLDTWNVYQGFDGRWTHKGVWKFAYDFVKKDDKGLSYQNEGKVLTDYYCFKKPVTSPVRGYVVHTSFCHSDNPIGVVDTLNNWGNHVIIQDERGFYTGLCHLAKDSIIVSPGQWVEPFQEIGLCGNSGYSPEPHLHMQYQCNEYLSSSTMPFTFTAITNKERIYHHCTPALEEEIAPYMVHDFYLQVTNFVLDEKLSFEVYKNNKKIENVEFKVSMALDGTFYLAHREARLYFGKMNSSFYFYHIDGKSKYLNLLFQAIPSLPLNYIKGKTWNDTVPEGCSKSKLIKTLLSLKNIFNFSTTSNSTYHFSSDRTVEGEIRIDKKNQSLKTFVKLDPHYRFKYFKVGEYHFDIIRGIK